MEGENGLPSFLALQYPSCKAKNTISIMLSLGHIGNACFLSSFPLRSSFMVYNITAIKGKTWRYPPNPLAFFKHVWQDKGSMCHGVRYLMWSTVKLEGSMVCGTRNKWKPAPPQNKNYLLKDISSLIIVHYSEEELVGKRRWITPWVRQDLVLLICLPARWKIIEAKPLNITFSECLIYIGGKCFVFLVLSPLFHFFHPFLFNITFARSVS